MSMLNSAEFTVPVSPVARSATFNVQFPFTCAPDNPPNASVRNVEQPP